MTERMFDDLGAWEAGELLLADLERMHGTGPIRGIIGVHEALSGISAAPVPDAATGWNKVRGRMDAPRPASRRRGHRVVVGALVAAVLSTSAAFAAPNAFHSVVDRVRHGIHSVFGESEGGSRTPTLPSRPTHGHDQRAGTPHPNDGPSGSKGEGTGGSTQSGGSSDQVSGTGAGDDDGQGSNSGGSNEHGSGDEGDQGGGGSDHSGGGSGSGDQGSGSGDQGSGSGSGDQRNDD
jgi:hypothetical protein